MTAVESGNLQVPAVPAYSHSFALSLSLPVASLCAPVQKALKDAPGLWGRVRTGLLRGPFLYTTGSAGRREAVHSQESRGVAFRETLSERHLRNELRALDL